MFVCFRRAQLAKERQQREDAVRQRKEMEERLRLYEEEYEKAKRGELRSYMAILLPILLDSSPFVQEVVGSNPSLDAT